MQPPRNHGSIHKDATDAFLRVQSHDLCMCGLGSCIWHQAATACNYCWRVLQYVFPNRNASSVHDVESPRLFGAVPFFQKSKVVTGLPPFLVTQSSTLSLSLFHGPPFSIIQPRTQTCRLRQTFKNLQSIDAISAKARECKQLPNQ